jgi:hypothetical protein
LKNTDKIVTVDARRPRTDHIRRAADAIREGGIVVFPTLGLYGLGADAFNAAAIGRIFDLKGRDSSKPVLVMICDRGDMNRLVAQVDARARFMMDRFWPGRVTFVLPALEGLSPGLTSADRKIGIRLAGHPVAAALIPPCSIGRLGRSGSGSGSGRRTHERRPLHGGRHQRRTPPDIALRRNTGSRNTVCLERLLKAGPASILTGPHDLIIKATSCRSGEIGKRSGLKIRRAQALVGSIPTSGTTNIQGPAKIMLAFTI